MSSALAFRRHAVIWVPLLSALLIVADVAIYAWWQPANVAAGARDSRTVSLARVQA